MSFLNFQLRDFIIKHFMGEQVSIRSKKNTEDNELDTFIEMPTVESNETQQSVSTPTHRFKYLENDILSKEFALHREPDILELKKHSIKLCLFNLKESLSVPFLEFFFENISGEFDFPQKELDMPALAEVYKKEKDEKINMENTTPFQPLTENENSADSEEEADFDEFEAEFFNQCSAFFQEITYLGDDLAHQRYLGFIEKEDVLYIVFDCTDLDILENIHLQKKDGYFIAIMDEILNKKQINETPIQQHVIELFESSPLLSNIYGQDNKQQPFPKLVYLCVQGESGYKNEYYENVETKTESENETIPLEKSISKSQSRSISIINPKVEHPFFDHVYLFTTEPFIKTSQKGVVQEVIQSITENVTTPDEINNIKRYALELDSVKYYKDIDIKTLIEKKELINPNYDVYCFYDDGREFWAVKSPTSFVEI